MSERFELHKMLLGDIGQEKPAPAREPVRVRHLYCHAEHRAINLGLAKGLREKKSLQAVAKELGVDQTTLAKHGPLYAAVRDQHRSIRQAEAATRQDAAISEAVDIVRQAMTGGRTASLRRAGEITGSCWRSSQLRASAPQLFRKKQGDPVVRPPARMASFGARFLSRVDEAARHLEDEVLATEWRLAA